MSTWFIVFFVLFSVGAKGIAIPPNGVEGPLVIHTNADTESECVAMIPLFQELATEVEKNAHETDDLEVQAICRTNADPA